MEKEAWYSRTKRLQGMTQNPEKYSLWVALPSDQCSGYLCPAGYQNYYEWMTLHTLFLFSPTVFWMEISIVIVLPLNNLGSLNYLP